MIYLYPILVFLTYHGLNILLGWWNVEIVMSRIVRVDKRQIEHGWWSIGYLLLCLPMTFIFNSWLALSVMMLHLSVFPVSYNLFRGMPTFYLSKTSSAVVDKFMVRMGLKTSEVVNMIAEAIAIGLFIFSLYEL